MGIDQRTQITDILKWVTYGSISISSFFLANTYRETQEGINSINEKIQSIEARTIRMEYELKLK